MEDVDDLLGPAPTPAKPTRRKTRKATKATKVDDLLGKTRKYRPLEVPKNPEPGGIFAARAEKGRNLGRTCLICKVELKHKRGRPPVICRKNDCFRAYRNLYRFDYDKVRAA